MNLIKLILSLVLFVMLDMMWFSYSFERIYNPSVISIQGQPIRLRVLSGLFAWFLLALGVNYFVLQSNQDAQNTQEIMMRGALFGFIVYGVYNGTLRAILTNYDMATFMSDLSWGTFATSFVSLATTYLYSFI